MMEVHLVVIPAVYFFVFVTGISGNALFIGAVLKNKKLQSCVFLLLANESLSDLIFALLSLFLGIQFLLDDWIFSDVFCRIHGAFIEVCFTVSILSLSAVAVERYLSICNIDHGRKSVAWCIKVCVVIWIVSFVVCAPLLYGYTAATESEYSTKTVVSQNFALEPLEMTSSDTNRTKITKEGIVATKCFITYWSKTAGLVYMCTQCAIIYVLPLGIMVFTHWRIAAVLKLTTRPTTSVHSSEESSCSSSSHSNNNNNNKEKEATQVKTTKTVFLDKNRYSTTISSIEKDKAMRASYRNVRIIKLLVTVTVTFFVLWSPFIVSRISTRMNNFIPEVGWAVIQLMVLLSTTTNFFISMKMSPQFKNTVTSIFGCSYRCAAHACETPSLRRQQKTPTSDSVVI